MVRLLLEKGVDIEVHCGILGKTALHLAIKENHEAIVQLLLQKGADIEARSMYGETVLLRAARHHDEHAVRRLLDMGADIKAKTNNGSTALILASSLGGDATFRLLLERGADINAVTNLRSDYYSTMAPKSKLKTMMVRRHCTSTFGMVTRRLPGCCSREGLISML
jgi:ankyrin repeat protein